MLAILIAFIILVIFMAFGVFGQKPDASTKDYYEMSSAATPQQYKDTTVAFSLQTAVTIYFVYWGFTYGLANIAFLATWFLGLFIFSSSAKRLGPVIRVKETLIAFIAESVNGRRTLALLLTLSFIGLAYAELFFASSFYGKILSTEKPQLGYNAAFWLCFALFGIGVLFYTSVGGVQRVVETDKWQLGIAYLGCATFTLAFANAAYAKSLHGFFVVYSLLAATYLGIALLGRTNDVSITSSFKRFQVRFPENCAWLSAFLIVGTMAVVPLISGKAGDTSLQTAVPGFLSMLDQPGGWAPIVGFGLANILWQFSDYTAFHRLRLLPKLQDATAQSEKIKTSILSTAFASPLTWGLGILVGLIARVAEIVPVGDVDVFGNLVSYCIAESSSGSAAAYIALVGLSIFLIAVLLSTIDSTFISLCQIVEVDFLRKSLSPVARATLLMTLGLLVCLFSVVHLALNVNILEKLSFIYSLSLVVAAPVCWKLLTGRLRVWPSILALLIAASMGFIALAMKLNLPPLINMVLPQLVAIIVSWILVPLFNFRKSLISHAPDK